jgi:hypothetical protein
MTERATPRPARRKRGPRPSTVVLSTLAAFLAILAFLAFQVRAGHDPALSRSSGQVAAVQQPQPKRIVVRKVEDDYVITKVVPAPRSATSVQPALTTGSSGGGSPAPVVTSSPAPAPAPAPAAPAPVTRTS